MKNFKSLAFASVHAMNFDGGDHDDMYSEDIARHTPRTLREAGERFVTFIRRVGESETPITQDDVDELFASECRKIVNGGIILTRSNMLPGQLIQARKDVGGKWTIDNVKIKPNPYCGTCSVEFTWESPKHIFFAELHVDKDGKIFELNEFYNLFNTTLGTPDGNLKE